MIARYFIVIFILYWFAVSYVSADSIETKSGANAVGNQDTEQTESNFTKKRVPVKKTLKSEYEIDYSKALFEHLHNKTVHFPIAFVIAAYLLALLSLKTEKHDGAISVMLTAALISAIIAMQTGFRQSSEFIGSEKEWIMNIHQFSGIALTMLIMLWIVVFKKRKYRKYHLVVGTAVIMLVALSGFFGGVLSHL